jgi:hypothetical protein
MDYSELSEKLTKMLSISEKKENGIYFSPPSSIQKNIEILKPYFKDIETILEPSCGSGEYITALCNLVKGINITAIELNKYIYDAIKLKLMTHKNLDIMNMDFLKYNTGKRYGLIIGNPPYYVMKKKDVDKKYLKYFDGRPNIFVLFIVKSLELLSENGILSFILPKSFTNCLYYDKLRKYINENYQIIDILDCSKDKYIETQQDTILFVIRKQPVVDNRKFVIHITNYTIITFKHSILELKKLYKDSTNLSKLGFKVSVGTVVWNQCKDILTDDNTKTRLIYSSDVKNNALTMKTYSNPKKKNYIDKEGLTELILVVNRGYGVGSYVFEYCLINEDFQYLIENHLICIRYVETIEKEELLKLYGLIIESLKNPKTTKFISTYFGNNAINTTELNYILPIYEE